MNDNFYLHSSERIKSERIRLGLKQAEASELCGVSRVMWGKYERAEAVPGGQVLLSFAAAGADVQYILTGIRSATAINPEVIACPTLTRREAALLDNYRHIADEGDKSIVDRTVLLVANATNRDEQESLLHKKQV